MPGTNPGTTGLVSWWALDEESGVRADSHGSNDLSDNNTTLFATGKQGNAADFVQANSEYLSRPSTTLFGAVSSFSVGGWLNVDAAIGGTLTVIDFNVATNGLLWYRATPGGSKIYRVYIGSTSNFGSTPSGTGSGGAWQHVVAVWDGGGATNADRLKIYIDGVSQSLSFSGTIPSSIASVSTTVAVGALFTGGNAFDGSIDEFVVYSGRALIGDEIAFLYNAGNGVTYEDVAGGAGSPLSIFAAQHAAMSAGGVAVG